MELSITTERTSTGAEHFHALDSLRGIAALVVLGLHFPSTSAIVQNAFVRNGWLFVDFFFVLSGFVIAASYGVRLRSGYPIGKFMFLRWGRLYPTLIAAVLITLAGQVAITAIGYGDAATLLTNLTSANSLIGLAEMVTLTWAIAFYDPHVWIGTSWSISVEFWAYIIAALVFRFAHRAVAAAFIGIAALSAAVLLATGDHNLLRINEFSLFRGLFGFSCGVLCHQLRGHKVLRTPTFSYARWTAVELALASATVAFVSLAGMGVATLVAPVLFLSVILVFSFEGGAISRVLRSRGPRFLGLISYPLYLVHFFLIFRILNVFMIVQRQLGVTMVEGRAGSHVFSGASWSGDLAAMACVALVIGVASLVHYAVEEPGRRWSRRVAATRWPGRRSAEKPGQTQANVVALREPPLTPAARSR